MSLKPFMTHSAIHKVKKENIFIQLSKAFHLLVMSLN